MLVAATASYPQGSMKSATAGSTWAQLKSDEGKTAYGYAAMNPGLKGTKQLQDLRRTAVVRA